MRNTFWHNIRAIVVGCFIGYCVMQVTDQPITGLVVGIFCAVITWEEIDMKKNPPKGLI